MDQSYLYSGGLAETVSRPTPITFSFLIPWFSGNGSLGRALQLLELPYSPTGSLVTVVDDQLYVDLKTEEACLYGGTIFYYKAQISPHDTPQMGISLLKLLSPPHLLNTLRITMYQAKIIQNPGLAVEKAQSFLAMIPEQPEPKDLVSVDSYLKDVVWPSVLAIGMISEFVSHLLSEEAQKKGHLQDVLSMVSREVSYNDWFFTSISHQKLVLDGKMSFEEYMDLYGMRGDVDYELNCPRWHEIPDIVRERIKEYTEPAVSQSNHQIQLNDNVKRYFNVCVRLQILRSEVRRRALVHIDALRQAIIFETKNEDISAYDRNRLIGIRSEVNDRHVIRTNEDLPKENVTEGHGVPVSRGVVKGKVQIVKSSMDQIKQGSIVVFPNASPEFSILYPKCAGMIFLIGGQTSHGAIVAREYKIAALVDSTAQNILEGSTIEMDGGNGEWKIINS